MPAPRAPRLRPMLVKLQVSGAIDDGTDLHPVELQVVAVPYAQAGAWVATELPKLIAQAEAELAGAAEVEPNEPPPTPPAPNRAQRRAKS